MKRLKRFLKNFWFALSRPEMLILPGHLAFFFLLSVVPILTLISYLAASLHLSMDFIMEFFNKSFGESISNILMPIVNVNNISFGFFITLIVGYLTASNGADSIITTSNMIYGIQDKGFIYRKIKSIIMTLFIVILFIFILVVPLFGEKIIELLEFVNTNDNVTNDIAFVINLLRGPLSWLIIFIIIKLLYTMAPDKPIPSRNVNYGAIFTSLGWVIITTIYSFYINNYANYSVIYGGLANLVILLLWFYLLAYIFVVGLALNYREESNKLSETTKIKVLKTEEK